MKSKQLFRRLKSYGIVAIALAFIGALLIASVPRGVEAAPLTSRKLTLGRGTAGASTTWTFTFSASVNTPLNGIAFQICTTASGACTIPGTGGNWDRSSAAFTSLTYNGTSQGGWALDGATAPCSNTAYLCIKNNASVTNTANPIVTTFSTVANPDITNTTFYARITTYTGDDFTGSLDTGVVAASTSTDIVLTGTMPESLVFCTGGSVSTTLGVPDCSTATSGNISFDALFSPTSTAKTTSQMAASTNASSGYVITALGPTLTSGGNSIAAIGGSATTSNIGTVGGQFGFNLVDNTTPNIGVDVAPAPNGTNYRGQASAPFGTVDNYAFQANTVQQVAASDNGGAGTTDAQIFTVSYIVNVSGSQAAGTYTTTLTYVCTPTF